MALVLCTGVNPALVRTRQMLLEQAGHSVVPALDETTLIAACQNNQFDVAVIGQTISPRSKRRVMQLVRHHCPSTKVLELYASTTGKILEDADSWLEVPADVPEELVQRVEALASDGA
jgi:CheY-like chemotaxis protein